MKNYILITLVSLLTISCNGQQDKTEKRTSEPPKGTWKVDKEFDEQGRLIKYDSVYSWSSHETLKDLPFQDQDSILQQYRSNFMSHFSALNSTNFEDMFPQDSLFNNSVFNNEFFKDQFNRDFTSMEELREQMIAEHKKLMENLDPKLIEPDTEQ